MSWRALRGKEVSQEEGDSCLVPSSTKLADIVRLRLRGRRRQTVPSDDDVQNVVVMGGSLNSCSSTR